MNLGLPPGDGGRGDDDVTTASANLARRLRRTTIGYLFQDYALIEDQTVRQNLAVAVQTNAFAKRVNVGPALDQVGLVGRADDPVHELSGGEQQRVALARLLLKNCSVILADEPTGALDETNTTMVVKTLQNFAEHGAVVIIATHSEFVTRQCTDMLQLSSG